MEYSQLMFENLSVLCCVVIHSWYARENIRGTNAVLSYCRTSLAKTHQWSKWLVLDRCPPPNGSFFSNYEKIVPSVSCHRSFLPNLQLQGSYYCNREEQSSTRSLLAIAACTHEFFLDWKPVDTPSGVQYVQCS